MSNNNVLPDWTVEQSSPVAITTAGRSTNNNEVLPDWANDVESNQVVIVDEPRQQETAPATTGATEIETAPKDEQPPRRWWDFVKRDGRLLLITLAIIVVMNIPFIKWLLYPFTIFSTFIHEICHAFAALMAGGRVDRILIFPDTSGLAYTAVPGGASGFVSSAGYQGTAVVGSLLLIFRRTKRGPRTGMMALACFMALTTIIWIRSVFGCIFIPALAMALGAAAYFLPSARMRDLYVCIAVTCSLNAITSVHDLFGANQVVNGEPSPTDAHGMQDATGVPSTFWALLWLFLALFLTFLALVFAIPGPDEVADFECCGLCQDLGLFKICNFTTRIRSRETPESSS